MLGSRYRLGGLLGHGGMSSVYRAVDTHTGEHVAVKVCTAGASYDARTRQQREALLGTSLTHPGIVRFLDFGEDDDGAGPKPFLVTELVSGPTLRQRLSARACTPDEVVALGRRLASVLEYLHSNGIVHRDLKPANVLLPGYASDDLGSAKLADFGVAIRLEDTRVTIEGNVVGTATYLSPEQVSGAPITSASDIYSLALMLIEALSGVASFEGSGVECALARLHRPPAIPPDTPQWLTSLLVAMTRMDPDGRPDALAVELALRDRDASAVAAAAATVGGANTSILEIGAEPIPAAVFGRPDEPTTVLSTRERELSWRWLFGLAGAVAALTLFGFAVSGGTGGSFSPPIVGGSHSPVAAVPTSAPNIPSPTAVAIVQHTSPAAKPAAPAQHKAPPPPKHHGKGPGHGGAH